MFFTNQIFHEKSPFSSPKTNYRSSFLDCPSAWHFVDGKCYLFERDNIVFHEAEKACKEMNAKLFEPQDLKTNELVFNMAKTEVKKWNQTSSNHHKYIFFWIGIHDTPNEGFFSYLRLGPFKIIWLICSNRPKNLCFCLRLRITKIQQTKIAVMKIYTLFHFKTYKLI